MKREPLEFVVMLARELPSLGLTQIVDTARDLMRLSAQHGRLAERYCNVPVDEAAHTAAVGRVEKRINAALADLGLPPASFGGDPRGYTVKITLPSGRGNTWGGDADGWGIPQ